MKLVAKFNVQVLRKHSQPPPGAAHMNRYYYSLLSEATSAKDEGMKIFDSRSSERLARDEVVVRPALDPNKALIDAILGLGEEPELEAEQRKRA